MRGRSGGQKNLKTERSDSVSGVPCKMMVWGNDRRLLVQVDGMEAAGGCTFANTRAVSRVCAKNPKSSTHSLVSAVRHKMEGWDDEGRLWVWVDGMEVLGGLRVRQREAGVEV